MTVSEQRSLAFARLTEIPPEQLMAHMSDPRVAAHMPLLTFAWDRKALDALIAAKEAYWHRDGLGHWAILCNGRYVGWGGFQNEGGEWDCGLVLKPDCFGLGPLITRKLIAFARADERIPFVTFLLPPSRRRLGALTRIGSRFIGRIERNGITFLKFRLDTGASNPARS